MTTRTSGIIAVLGLLLGLGFVNPPCFAQESDPITITTIGRGPTIGDARKDAVMIALREAIEMHVDPDIIEGNDELVEETVTAFATDESLTVNIIDRAFEGDDISVTCQVSLVPDQLVKSIEASALNAMNIDGEALAAELAANPDDVDAQKMILNHLLGGLAPRLLVARLVDREGNVIEDHRPVADDVKKSGDEVTFALNIELYYDLQTFYDRVYPNLEKVLQAVAIESLPAEVSSSPYYGNKVRRSPDGTLYKGLYTAFTGYTSSEPKWSTRSSRLGLQNQNGSLRFENPNPQQFTVMLSRSRDRYGDNEGFDAFVLPMELVEPFQAWAATGSKVEFTTQIQRYTLPRMRVVLESAAGTVLTQQEVVVVDHALMGNPNGSGEGDKEIIPFQELFRRDRRGRVSTWITRGDESLSKDSKFTPIYPIVISPRFIYDQVVRNDTLLLRTYVTLPKEDFERLASIRFDFWDSRVEE